jgi:hypothetical protein
MQRTISVTRQEDSAYSCSALWERRRQQTRKTDPSGQVDVWERRADEELDKVLREERLYLADSLAGLEEQIYLHKSAWRS